MRQYPDKPLDVYIKKYEYNMKYEYTAPTWKSLLLGRRKDGAVLDEANMHIRYPVIWALMKRGLVTVEKPQKMEGFYSSL